MPSDRLETMDFIPPAPIPPARDPSVLTLLAKMAKSQIEGWPKALFEAGCWKAPGGALFVMHPEAVKAVLQDQADHFTTGALFRRMVGPAWGNGILTAQGKHWRVQRRAAAGAFRPIDMARLTPFFVGATEQMLRRWTASPGLQVDVLTDMTQLTFNIVLDTMLSGAADFDRSEMSSALQALFSGINRIRIGMILLPDRYHEKRPNVRAPEREKLLAMIASMIVRRRSEAPVGDLLDLLMQARDPESGDGFDDELLADNLLGFILAGHETTTLALTWALFLVSSHAPTKEALRKEVASVVGAEAIGPQHIADLHFARQIISEALRLYPPAFLLTRIAGRDTSVIGHKVKVGQRINIPVYAIHRRADVFPNPHSFDPCRFGPDNTRPDRYSYLPFGAGPRICLGASFAMTEAVAVLSTIVRSVDLKPLATHKVWPVAQVSLRPRGGMPMIVSSAR